MSKEFDRWNEQKKKINNEPQETYFDNGEIWWCALGVNVGHEQDGVGDVFQRPILVLKKLSKDTCVVVPLTTSKNRHPLRLFVGVFEGKESYAVLSQLRVIDVRRFMKKVDLVDIEKFEKIRNSAKDML